MHFANAYGPPHIDWAYWHIDMTSKSLISRWIDPLHIDDIPSIYFYQGNITFKSIINLVSFIINLVEYLVINSYSVTVLDNFRKETSDRAKSIFFGGIQQPHFHSGESPPPPWSAILDEGLMKVSLWQFELPHFFFTSLQVRELCSCMALSIKLHTCNTIFWNMYTCTVKLATRDHRDEKLTSEKIPLLQ